MNNEQKEVIKDIYSSLESVVNNKSGKYIHKIKDGKKEWTETVNREQHLQVIIEWTLQQIENNFELEEENE
ncbi:TPA: type II toxin-antitoxin system antitoxin TscA [Staphylococcus aureus]